MGTNNSDSSREMKLRETVRIMVETSPIVIAVLGIITFIVQQGSKNSFQLTSFTNFLTPVLILVVVFLLFAIFFFSFASSFSIRKSLLLFISGISAVISLLLAVFFIAFILPQYGWILALLIELFSTFYILVIGRLASDSSVRLLLVLAVFIILEVAGILAVIYQNSLVTALASQANTTVAS
ncbi:MAG: hypothetical protein LVQ95_00270 [Candidatus Micrarchaeales archaeon]|nr:hypothetical protein [Candidatus Micrarchaeales archaeon]